MTSRRDLRLALARMAHDAIKQYDRIDGGRVRVGKPHHYASSATGEYARQFVVEIGQRVFIIAVTEAEDG